MHLRIGEYFETGKPGPIKRVQKGRKEWPATQFENKLARCRIDAVTRAETTEHQERRSLLKSRSNEPNDNDPLPVFHDAPTIVRPRPRIWSLLTINPILVFPISTTTAFCPCEFVSPKYQFVTGIAASSGTLPS